MIKIKIRIYIYKSKCESKCDSKWEPKWEAQFKSNVNTKWVKWNCYFQHKPFLPSQSGWDVYGTGHSHVYVPSIASSTEHFAPRLHGFEMHGSIVSVSKQNNSWLQTPVRIIRWLMFVHLQTPKIAISVKHIECRMVNQSTMWDKDL